MALSEYASILRESGLCPQAHSLEWGRPPHAWYCSHCRKAWEAGKPCTECAPCDYKLCGDCRPAPIFDATPYVLQAGVCPNLHALQPSCHSQPWRCDKCSRQGPAEEKHMRCPVCDYDACTLCAPLPPPPPPPSAAPASFSAFGGVSASAMQYQAHRTNMRILNESDSYGNRRRIRIVIGRGANQFLEDSFRSPCSHTHPWDYDIFLKIEWGGQLMRLRLPYSSIS